MITVEQLLREVRGMGGNERRWKLWYLCMKQERGGEEAIEDNMMSMEQLNRRRNGILGDLEPFGIVNVRLFPQDMLLRQANEGMIPGAVQYVGMNNDLTRNLKGAYFGIRMGKLDSKLREYNGRLQIGEVAERAEFWRYTTGALTQYSPVGFLINGHGGYIDDDYHAGFGHFPQQRLGVKEFTEWLKKVKRRYGDVFVNLMTCHGGEMIEEISRKSNGSLKGLRIEGPKGLVSLFQPYITVSEQGKIRVKCHYFCGEKLVEKTEVGE